MHILRPCLHAQTYVHMLSIPSHCRIQSGHLSHVLTLRERAIQTDLLTFPAAIYVLWLALAVLRILDEGWQSRVPRLTWILRPYYIVSSMLDINTLSQFGTLFS